MIHRIRKEVMFPIETSERRSIAPIDEIEDMISTYCQTRFNTVTERVEIKHNQGEHFAPLDLFSESTLLRYLAKNNIKCTSRRLHEILTSNFSQLYDPFEDYFNNLPDWDQQTDYIQQLADTVTTTNQDLWSEMLKKWLVAAVACALADNVNHTVLIFTGAQGIGKTTWLNRLIPQELNRYFHSGLVSSNNKDTLIHLTECMVIVMDELETLNKTGIESLKQLITQGNNRIRRPYGRNAEAMIRRASFVGSTNNPEFLIDTTGSRRFLCNQVTAIQYDHNIDLNLVYAQAFFQYRDGFRYWFNKDEIAELRAHNEQFQERSFEEDYLRRFVAPAERSGKNFFPASAILLHLNRKANGAIKSNPSFMGKMLAQHGYESVKINGIRGYYVTLL